VIVVDTTVLVYAVGGEHALRESSRRFVRAIQSGRIEATTTVEVVQEFAHARARRHGRADAVQRAREAATFLSPLLVTQAAALEQGLELFERHERLDAFDAVLAATAIEHGADALVSADTAFAGIRGLRHVAPGTPAFERLIGA
jgi:hypothetical protein